MSMNFKLWCNSEKSMKNMILVHMKKLFKYLVIISLTTNSIKKLKIWKLNLALFLNNLNKRNFHWLMYLITNYHQKNWSLKECKFIKKKQWKKDVKNNERNKNKSNKWKSSERTILNFIWNNWNKNSNFCPKKQSNMKE